MTAAGSPAAQPLYDARRGVYYAKPVLRGWLHLLCFGASLVAGPLLLAHRHGAARITAVAIYSASVSALFGISALYHRGTWTEAGRPTTYDHANRVFKETLARYERPPLDPAIEEELDAFVARRKQEGGVPTDF